jgi:hypothetical protein
VGANAGPYRAMDAWPRVLARASPDFEVIDCNAAFCELMGQSVVGSSLFKVLSGDEALESAISAAARGDECECHLSLCTARRAHPMLMRAHASLVPRGEVPESIASVSGAGILQLCFVVATNNIKR